MCPIWKVCKQDFFFPDGTKGLLHLDRWLRYPWLVHCRPFILSRRYNSVMQTCTNVTADKTCSDARISWEAGLYSQLHSKTQWTSPADRCLGIWHRIPKVIGWFGVQLWRLWRALGVKVDDEYTEDLGAWQRIQFYMHCSADRKTPGLHRWRHNQVTMKKINHQCTLLSSWPVRQEFGKSVCV